MLIKLNFDEDLSQTGWDNLLQVPDFKKLHQQMSEKLENAKNRPSTIITPFRFKTNERIRQHHVWS